MRTESDFLGSVKLPDDCLYGINTAKAVSNFSISGKAVHKELIYELIMLKRSAAVANRDAGLLDDNIARYIVSACDKLSFKIDMSLFPTDTLQGGAGTSINMNVNEVVCNTALLIAGRRCGDYDFIDPLDHVNLNQSTNDIFPTAVRIASIKLIRKLSDGCAQLQTAFQAKEQEFAHIKKIGRTELMNATEITLGEQFGSYAQCIARDRWRIYKAEERLRFINIGGAAVGKAANNKYVFRMTELIRKESGIGLARAEYPMDITQNCDVFAEVSGLLKSLAVDLIKIANDLRLMNAEFIGEVKLSPMQKGSTAMPGKVNPVIPEAVIQAAVKAMSNDTAVTYASSMGNFELNAFMPLIADSFIDSLKILTGAVLTFTEKCVKILTADKNACGYHLEHSRAYAMKYVPVLGYEAVEKLLVECENNKERFIALAEGNAQAINGKGE